MSSESRRTWLKKGLAGVMSLPFFILKPQKAEPIKVPQIPISGNAFATYNNRYGSGVIPSGVF